MSKIIQEKILLFIKQKKITKTKEIEEKFKLTQSSTRRYLIKLENSGLIERLFGEVILKESQSFRDQDFDEKINSNVDTKRKIAQYASKLVQNHKTIFVDSGSLCYFLLEYLDKKIELFTNSLSNAKRAIDLGFENINIIGGKIKQDTKAIVNLNEEELIKINFPISFIGVNAIDELGNLYTPEKKEAKAKNDIIKRSIITIILAEEEKFNTKSTFNFNSQNQNIIIVTNAKIKNLKNKNIQIINTKEKNEL